MKRNSLIAALALYFIAAILYVSARYGGPSTPPIVSEVVRWAALIALCAYASTKRSLTTWIIVGMVAGAEIGHDFPAFASGLRLLSQIFLQMIKVIIAPLLFATLVSGIAGHADLKKVGRMGVKAIVYFEVVTTLALVIGLAAINISKAGVGMQMPAAATTEKIATVKPTAAEIILHVFRRTSPSRSPRTKCFKSLCSRSSSASRWRWSAKISENRCSSSPRAWRR